MSSQTKIDHDIEELLDDIARRSHHFTLILFNDDTHDMQEVATQIMRAAQCSEKQAVAIMLKAHTTGKAEVLSGPKEKVEKAAKILGEIGLKTAIVEK